MIYWDVEMIQRHGDTLIAALCEQLDAKDALLSAREKELTKLRDELRMVRAELVEYQIKEEIGK